MTWSGKRGVSEGCRNRVKEERVEGGAGRRRGGRREGLKQCDKEIIKERL